MDRREHERSSSSPSVKIRIQSIQERGTSGTLLSVVLDDGSSFFIAPELCCPEDKWITPGSELLEERFSRLEELEQETHCRQKALDLLARRSHSSLELRQKLLIRSFSKRHVENTNSWLLGKGFLNDLEYARNWLEHRQRRGGESRTVLEIGLRKKGISSEIIKDIFKNYSQEQEKESLAQAWNKLMRRSSMTEDRAVKTLIRKGFSYSLIQSFLKEPDRNIEMETY